LKSRKEKRNTEKNIGNHIEDQLFLRETMMRNCN